MGVLILPPPWMRRLRMGFQKGNKLGFKFQKGHVLTEESKKKKSEALKGNTNTLGHKLSEEHKRKISLTSTGRTHICTEESKRKMSEIHLGVYPSEETRLKMCESHKGKPSYMLGKYHSKETKYKMSLAHIGKQKGEKGSNWKGGITPINHTIRNSFEYQNWRTAVFERDNYTCQDCNTKSGKGNAVYLEAHHLKSFAEYPELRFEVSNGITYCEPCHKAGEFHKGIQKLKVLTI